MADKKDIYKRIKIAGIISYIPIVLLVSVFGGYFLGDFLVKKFNLPDYVIVISIGIGLIAAIRETVRIIRLALKIEQDK